MTRIRSRLSQISKAEKWFDKARFGNFCRVIWLKSGVALWLVLVASYALLGIAMLVWMLGQPIE